MHSKLKTIATGIALGTLLGCHSAAAPAAEPLPEHSATIPTPRSEKWIAYHDHLKRVAQGRERTDLVFLGDSITQGWTLTAREVWDEFYGERHALSFSTGGDRTEHVLWRITNGAFDGLRPRLVVLLIGTNNTVRKGDAPPNTPREIADGIAAIVRELGRRLPETRVLLLGIFPRGPRPQHPLRQKIAATNALLGDLADGERVFYLDISDRFIEEDGTISQEVMADYLHLTPHGYRIWAEAIEEQVARLLEESG